MLTRRYWLVGLSSAAAAQQVPPGPVPVPRMQALPLPGLQVSFERDGREVTRYHCHPEQRRPFLYPVVGPSGRSLTRMGHPHDPVTHSHHNSVWIAHQDVNGVNFWTDGAAPGRIVHERIEKLDDSASEASLVARSEWINTDTGKPLLRDRRRIAVIDLPGNELLIIIDLELTSMGGEVRFGKTPFGLIGVRMAKTIGVYDGGGTIRNSEGQSDEPNVLWKRARWADYSGPITATATDGITLFDHPSNPNHPTFFHVRRDGWMGASLTYDEPRVLVAHEKLRLRYGLYVHAGAPSLHAIARQWEAFGKLQVQRF